MKLLRKAALLLEITNSSKCIGIIVDEICLEKKIPLKICLYCHAIIKMSEDLSHVIQGALEKKISQCDLLWMKSLTQVM